MPADLETTTQQIGRDIFALAKHMRNGSDLGGSWDRWVMKLGMRDEQVKAQLFRFVDVLPTLESPRQVNDHLRQYLGPVRERLPMALGRALPHLPEDGWLGERIAGLTRWGTRRLARRFIAATDVPEAIHTVERLRRRGLAFTIDLLGEAVLSESEAQLYQQRYLDLINGLTQRAPRWPVNDLIDRNHKGGQHPRVNVSLKLSALYSQFDPSDPEGTSAAVRKRLRPIMRLTNSQARRTPVSKYCLSR